MALDEGEGRDGEIESLLERLAELVLAERELRGEPVSGEEVVCTRRVRGREFSIVVEPPKRDRD